MQDRLIPNYSADKFRRNHGCHHGVLQGSAKSTKQPVVEGIGKVSFVGI